MSVPHLVLCFISKLARDRAALAVLVAAAAGRVLWLVLVDNAQWGDVQAYDSAARHLALNGELRYDGYPAVYRAWFPPAWPFFLSLFYRVFGTEHELFKLVNLALALLTMALTMRIGGRVFGRRVGLAGGWFMALLPGQIFYVNLAQYEMFLTALVAAPGSWWA
jgi:4-amino-4-deoxy-L-arabinose transferase-like glycosyltransferase